MSNGPMDTSLTQISVDDFEWPQRAFRVVGEPLELSTLAKAFPSRPVVGPDGETWVPYSLSLSGNCFTVEFRREDGSCHDYPHRHPNRKAAEVLATARGYFWLPCPICQRPFAGFEYGGSISLNDGTGVGVCPDCREPAKDRNRWRQITHSVKAISQG